MKEKGKRPYLSPERKKEIRTRDGFAPHGDDSDIHHCMEITEAHTIFSKLGYKRQDIASFTQDERNLIALSTPVHRRYTREAKKMSWENKMSFRLDNYVRAILNILKQKRRLDS